MRQVVLASVRTYARRYVAAVLAIVVGVGFIVTTNALASSARNGLLADLGEQYTGARSVLADVSDAAQAGRLLEEAGPGTTSVNARTMQPLAVEGANVAEEAGIGSVSAVPSLRWQELTRGAFPTRAGEALADVNAAEANGVEVGDTVTVGDRGGNVEVRVVGLVESSSGFLSAPVYLTWDDLRTFDHEVLVTDVVSTRGAGALSSAVSFDGLVQPVDDYLEVKQQELTNGVNVVAVMLLVFAAIAFFVSALVIANTFTILLAQRMRDFALLRCVGATRAQIIRSVRVESLLIGVVSATVGVLAGAGLGYGAVALGGRVFPTLPVGEVQLSALWVAGAWLMGVAVTFTACLLPARRSTRISPLAALRPHDAVDHRSRAGVLRLLSAALALVAGTVLLALSTTTHNLVVMIAGGAVSFIGVLLLGPVLVPAGVRILGLALGRTGVPGRLAASNALRNPRRTAATAASLLVGVTLIAGLVVGMATVRSTIDVELDAEYPVDAAMTSTTEAMPAGVVDQVRGTAGVADAGTVDGAVATLEVPAEGGGTHRMPLLGTEPGIGAAVHGTPEFLTPPRNTMFLPWETIEEQGLRIGGDVKVRVGERTETLTVAGGDGFGDAAVVSTATLRGLAGDAVAPHAVWVRATGSADAADLRGQLSTVAQSTGAELSGGLENRAFIDLQLDVMTGATIGLLAVGVVIALVGIGNTLGLSVLERTREHALLRAMGLTRRQLRATLSAEAVLLATVAGILGVALGVTYAWVAVQAVIGEVVDGITLVVPAGQLAAVVGVAAAAGLLACLLPARRAAQVTPAAGLTAD